MVKGSDCTTKIVVALVIGLLIGGVCMVLVQNKFFKQPKPDDDKAVAKQKNTCTYTCQLSAIQNAKGSCPAATQLLEKGRTEKPAGDQTTDLLLFRRMNDVGWRLKGGDSNMGWSSALSLTDENLQYECTGRGLSAQTTTIVLEVVGACPSKEQVCPNGILEQLPDGAKTDQNYATALAEANANAQAQLELCQKTMNKRCEKLSDDVSKRYWDTYDNNKAVTETLAGKKTFCDRRGVTLLKKYTSDEQYDSLVFIKDKLSAPRIESMKQYLQALSSPAEIASIKNFILGDLADTNAEWGGGLVQGQSPTFKAYPSANQHDDEGYSVGADLARDYKQEIVRSIWHVHAINDDGNPLQEGPSGDPEHPRQDHDDFNNIYTLTNGEAVITYMGKDANGKICFNVKFYTRKNIVIDLGDYDP